MYANFLNYLFRISNIVAMFKTVNCIRFTSFKESLDYVSVYSKLI